MNAPGVAIRRRIRRSAAMAALATSAAVLAPVAVSAAPAPGSADLSASVVHSPASPLSGTDLTFTITATNDGPGSSADVLSALSFDYPFQFKSASAGCALSGQGISVICRLGAVGAGSSARAKVTVTPQVSGVFVVPVVVSSETPDPDVADRSTTDTIIVQRGPSQGARYVAGIYPLILGRPADPGAIKYWGDRFQALSVRGQPTVSVPAAIIASLEGRQVRVRQAYERILKRAPGNEALAYWAGRLGRGLTDEGLNRQLLRSREFERRHSGDLYASCYRAVLGRSPTADEQRQLDAGGGIFNLAYFQHTTEAYNRVIDDLIRRTFDRTPTLADRYFTQLDLRAGLSGEGLWAKLLVSGEFLQKYPRTEDDYYPPIGVPVPLGRYDFTGRQAAFTR